MPNLRQQKKGGQVHPWTIDELEAGLAHFYNEHQRYPTATEIDRYAYLPSSRSIERSFGGLIEVRKKLGLKGQDDFRTGKHSSLRASKINARNHLHEKEVYDFLVKKYKKEFVHREYFFTDDKRTRADFFIYHSKGAFCLDIFYPADRRNLSGCLNSKIDKYSNPYMREYPIIFLQMNKDISDAILINIVQNKKKRLSEGQMLMGWDTFVAYSDTKTPLSINGR